VSDAKSVLIIEDDTAVRETIQEILEIQGYKVFSAANGKEGTEVLKTCVPSPSVILLDLMMPVMNGWQFLDIQRNDPKLRDIPVVICSAYKETARAVKPNAFIEKPVQFKALLGAIKAFCA
jgi:CheY-like chemotaxis protein